MFFSFSHHLLNVNAVINILDVFCHQRAGFIHFGHQQYLGDSCRAKIRTKIDETNISTGVTGTWLWHVAMTHVLTQQVGLFPYCRKFVHHFLAEQRRLTCVDDINHTVNLVGQSRILPEPRAVWPDGSQRVELGCKKRMRAQICLLSSTTGLTGTLFFFSFCCVCLRPGNDLSYGPGRC